MVKYIDGRSRSWGYSLQDALKWYRDAGGGVENRAIIAAAPDLLAELEDYLSILRQEYDYLTSEEHAREMIEANEYTFTVDGERED